MDRLRDRRETNRGPARRLRFKGERRAREVANLRPDRWRSKRETDRRVSLFQPPDDLLQALDELLVFRVVLQSPILGHRIQPRSKDRPQLSIVDKVLNKVVEQPMTDDDKGAYANDSLASFVLWSMGGRESPVEAGDEAATKVVSREKGAIGEEEIGQELFVDLARQLSNPALNCGRHEDSLGRRRRGGGRRASEDGRRGIAPRQIGPIRHRRLSILYAPSPRPGRRT